MATQSWSESATRMYGWQGPTAWNPPAPAADALLVASALHHELTLITSNEADFAGLGTRVLNPFGRVGN